MHEGAIAESIVDILKESADANGIEHILKVRLRIGVLSGIMVDALLFALEALKGEERLIKDTVFDVERVWVKARCVLCNREFQFRDEGRMVLLCPDCGMPLDILMGKEMEILEIEGE